MSKLGFMTMLAGSLLGCKPRGVEPTPVPERRQETGPEDPRVSNDTSKGFEPAKGQGTPDGSLGRDGGNQRERDSFYVDGHSLRDGRGAVFVARGVNNPHNYFKERAFAALDRVAGLGANSVRIVWCATTLERQGRCDTKDMHPLGDLEKILRRLRELRLVAILEAQNATGSDNPQDLARLVDWYVQDDVKDLLRRYQDMLLINIANEWMSVYGNPLPVYVPAYKEAIGRLRAAGLGHVLVIDAPGWGQDFDGLLKAHTVLRDIDDDIVYSAHMYELFPDETKVREAFAKAEAAGMPLMIGEFGCSHGGKPVACEAIMREASREQFPVGYLGWSVSGNGAGMEYLNLLEVADWTTLTTWGRTLFLGSYGIQATAKKACILDPSACP